MIGIDIKPNKYHSDFVDAFAYMISAEMAKQLDGWITLHIAPKPKWIPKFIYDWLIGKLFVINKFR